MNWEPHARQLMHEVATSGAVYDRRWKLALRETPRHQFVPSIFTQRGNGSWVETTSEDPGWLAKAYRNDALVTKLATTPAGDPITVSSSTKPGLMMRMLEALEVRDGQRVLEIGTGTGYNAALLCHRLGAAQVFSVDIGQDLVHAASARLAALGYEPTLVTGDGAGGMPEHAPFDRIIATCSVPAIPDAWQQQVRQGGIILADLKLSENAGNLVLLRRTVNGLHGRFLPRWAGFMAMRAADIAPTWTASAPAEAETTESTTELEPYPWTMLVPWFLANIGYAEPVRFGMRGFVAGKPQWTYLESAGGSWARVRINADNGGRRTVVQGGPRRLWDVLEAEHQHWTRLGRPDWSRFGLTVTPEGEHTVWLDNPERPQTWPLQHSP
ncbi:protein-L-isoaspartate(D-aspartate) O-methyltransferase [Tamaricihabitans halophyticus]|uniref:Protein-L-isoaspartate O-methyltransferase n=1 Tax=Tamaricihabitans halophyticus TaxID=1262583 RepID=A0A4V2SUJ9_9PSEU|nr:methyltransferase domain-containing protein [Tamaricihabitans halophyticus]TCP54876.1 protein-L-isoaspartate(D-aspartate) O-methyltransferase [Tamaricihabitans halophyticus]